MADLYADYAAYGNRVGEPDPELDFELDPDSHYVSFRSVADFVWSYDETDIPDQARWSPPAEGEPVRLLSQQEAAQYTNVRERWIKLSIAVPFPDPDGRIGSTAGWLQSTLDWWKSADPLRRGPRKDPLHFMNRVEVVEYLGLRARGLSGITLPPPDAVIGVRRSGWLPTTIDAWKAQRPGRGRWQSTR